MYAYSLSINIDIILFSLFYFEYRNRFNAVYFAIWHKSMLSEIFLFTSIIMYGKSAIFIYGLFF